eukprot:Sspe_Gene.64422::Locus_38059_Transcript_1_1_Confidence_1.000_Length_452::g.64422::m.64422
MAAVPASLPPQKGLPGATLPLAPRLLCEGEVLNIPRKAPAGIIPECEWLGVPFNCKNAECGHCRVKVLKGIENLLPAGSKERKFFGKDFTPSLRLACQAKLQGGDVEIERVSIST